MTDKTKRPVGRPRVPERLQKKRTTRTMRVPIAIIDELKAIVVAYKEGVISKIDARDFSEHLLLFTHKKR
jgi:hypothetical protein